MSQFCFMIFSNPTTLYILGLLLLNGGIIEDSIKNLANICNFTPIHMTEHTNISRGIAMPEHNNVRASVLDLSSNYIR